MSLISRRHFLVAGVAALSAGGFAAPALAQAPYPLPGTVIIAPREPPGPRYERIPPPPRHRREIVVWRQGHWHWNGRRWVWINGRYIDRPRRGAIWVPGHWEARGPGWAYIPGHWQ